MQIAPEVAEALAGGRPVVALESTLISHGLPRPRNLEVARQVEDAVRADGALPATIAVVGGAARIGLDDEALETLNVTVLGYGTDEFPGFYLADSGHPAPWRVDSPEQVADVVRARGEVGVEERAIVVANPLPAAEQLDPELHDRVLAAGLQRAAPRGGGGEEDTPLLLDPFPHYAG